MVLSRRMSTHPNSIANLNRKGRPSLFTERSAFEVLEARKMFEKTTTAATFLAEMKASGMVPMRACVDTINRLLQGKLFPNLTVWEGDQRTSIPYDYSQVPRAARARPRNETRYDTDVRPSKLSPTQERIAKSIETRLMEKVLLLLEDQNRARDAEIREMRKRLELLAQQRIDELAARLRHNTLPQTV